MTEIEAIVTFIIAELEAKIHKSGQKAYDGFLKHFDAKSISFMNLNNLKDHESKEVKEESEEET